MMKWLQDVKMVERVFLFTVLVYFGISAFYFLGKNGGAGDELLFINDLAFVKNHGWIAAIEKNISIPYLLFSYPFSFFLPDYVALRIANVVLTVLMFVYFYKQKEKLSFHLYLLFFVSTVGYFFSGTNDTLFFISLIVFVNEVNTLQNNKSWNGTLAFSALFVAFFTRELVFVYFPVLMFCFYLISRNRGFSGVNYLYPFGVLLLFIALNFPSLTVNGKLSYDLKSPPAHIHATWAQRQYLAQLMVNKGELPNYNHPTWEQTDEYLKKNGNNSLPKSTLEGLLFDVKLTVVEFFKDFSFTVFYSFRQLGLILIVPLFFVGKAIIKKRRADVEGMLLPLSMWVMIAVFSLIIISFVELRWLAPVFVLNILYYSTLQRDNRIPNKILLLNYVILIVFSFYGCFNLSKKIIDIL